MVKKKKHKREDMRRSQKLSLSNGTATRRGENPGEKVGQNNRGSEGKKLAGKNRELRPEKKTKRQFISEIICISKVQVQKRLPRV